MWQEQQHCHPCCIPETITLELDLQFEKLKNSYPCVVSTMSSELFLTQLNTKSMAQMHILIFLFTNMSLEKND